MIKNRIKIIIVLLIIAITSVIVYRLPLYMGDGGVHIVSYSKKVISISEEKGKWIGIDEYFVSSGEDVMEVRTDQINGFKNHVNKKDIKTLVEGDVKGINVNTDVNLFDDNTEKRRVFIFPIEISVEYKITKNPEIFVVPKGKTYRTFYRLKYSVEEGERVLKDYFSKKVVSKNHYIVKRPVEVELTLREYKE